MSNKITAEHSKEFFRYVLKWQAALGLADWRFEMARRRSVECAEVSIYPEMPLAIFYVGKSFGDVEVTPETLEYFALHEVCHVFLYVPITSPSDTNEHRAINVLVKRLLEPR
jgi:hypothetical protein